jgi:transcriptional regulator with XRE-family HTH domain
MAPNIALKQARQREHLSQDGLARKIREAGFRLGEPNGCNKATVQRWEAGKTQPQAHMLLALEAVLNQPAASLGFADEQYGMDRDRMLADAELDISLPIPEPSAKYGPLTGIWLSTYEYESTSRNAIFSDQHYVMLLQRGARVTVRSLPKSASRLSMDMSQNGSVVTGTWTEHTSEQGYYGGAVYYGAIQLLQDPTDRRLRGKWVGFGRDLEVNTGPWQLTLVDSHVTGETVGQYSRVPGADASET